MGKRDKKIYKCTCPIIFCTCLLLHIISWWHPRLISIYSKKILLLYSNSTHLSEHIYEWMDVLHGLMYVYVYAFVSSRAALYPDVVDIHSALYATHVMLLLRLYTISDTILHALSQLKLERANKGLGREKNEVNRFKYQKYMIKYLVLIYQWDYIIFFNGVVDGYDLLSKRHALSSSILM